MWILPWLCDRSLSALQRLIFSRKRGLNEPQLIAMNSFSALTSAGSCREVAPHNKGNLFFRKFIIWLSIHFVAI
jgi:hypothetical protein